MLHNTKWIFHQLFSWHLKKRPDRAAISAEILKHLDETATKPINQIFKELKTSESGLSSHEATLLLKRIGLNEIIGDRPVTSWRLLLRIWANPFVLLLLALSLLSFFLGDMNAVYIIMTMVLISIVMRFIQEFRSNLAAEKLKAMIHTKATVIRSNKEIEIPFQKIVPGDLIKLSAGDMLPADVRLITAHDLFISESSLTGESMPIEKNADYHNGSKKHPLELSNICLMGTNVISGLGKGIVISTGSHTYFGSIAKTIVGKRPATNFDIGINKISLLLISLMLCMVPVIFLINGFSKGDWFQSLLFALSVAVGLTPELLPMILTTNLAKGAYHMAKNHVIVKQLSCIQNFGAMNILCTDKTGTLTEDRVILEQHLDLEGHDSDEVLLLAYLNSHYQTGLKNLLDVAILEHTELEETVKSDYEKIDEIPFDFMRKRMSVVTKTKSQKDAQLICKGSISTVASICTKAKIHNSIVPLTKEVLAQIQILHDKFNAQGLRMLAIAYKELPLEKDKTYHVIDENELTLIGFLSFLDPPKHSTTKAIKNLQDLGIEVKILTGDNEVITQRICKAVKLTIKGILTGQEIDALDENKMEEIFLNTTIFAKLNPMQKALVVRKLKGTNRTIGYLGDGINDAPALRESDIGISVDTATDIAKESSDIIMLEKNLLFLGQGVLEGRATFCNIIKYIKMALSSNFGNVLSLLGASAFLPFLPMLPVQLLLQNLLYDFSQMAIPFDNVDKDYLKEPRNWSTRGVERFMFFIGPISSIFDYATFALLWFFFGANTPAKQAFFQSGWFIEGLISQVLIVHMIRTPKLPFIQSFPSKSLLFTTFSVIIVGLWIPFSFIGSSIGMQALPLNFFLWLIPIILSYCTVTQCVKFWFIKKFHYWI